MTALRRYSLPMGIALLILAQVLWYLRQDTPIFGAVLALPGLALLLLNPSKDFLPSSPVPVQLDVHTDQFHFGLLQIIEFVLGVGLALLISWLGIVWQNGSTWLILFLWLLSALLVFLALVGVSAIRSWISKVRHSLSHDWREWLIVSILMVAGLALRLIWLDRLPKLFGEDEARFALQAVQLASGWYGSPLRYDDILNYPMIYHLALAVSIQLFGQTVAAARLPSALIGTLAIPGVYLAARRMFTSRLALFAAALLTTLTIHVHFSRIALNNIIDPTIAIWTFAFLVGAIRSGDPVEYGLVGMLVGLSQYGYSSSRLLPPLVVIYLALVFLQNRLTLIHHGKRLIIALILGVIVFLPLASWLVIEHGSFNPRLSTIAAWLPVPSLLGLPQDSSQYLGYWTRQVSQSIFSYVQVKETSLFFGQMVPLLGWIMPVFFLIGLAVMLKGWRDPSRLILVIWLVATTLFGSALITEPPQYQRLLILAPFLVIVIAAGILAAVNALIPNLPERYHRNLIRSAPLLLVLILIETDLKTYLVDYAINDPYFADPRTQAMNTVGAKVLPDLQGDVIWYLPTWWFNLGTTPILKYKLPWFHAILFENSPDELITALKKTSGKQAVFLPLDYPGVGEYYSKLLTLPNAEATDLLPLPNHLFALVLVRFDMGP